jgi:hypothetical protein
MNRYVCPQPPPISPVTYKFLLLRIRRFVSLIRRYVETAPEMHLDDL